MGYKDFIHPTDVKIGSRKFVISKIPAIVAQTRVYPSVAKAISSDGMLGLTMLPIDVVRTILSCVAYRDEDGEWLELDTDERVNKAFEDFKDLPAVIVKMVKENFDFLIDGSLREVLGIAEAEAESVS